jgi:hypothetical protein
MWTIIDTARTVFERKACGAMFTAQYTKGNGGLYRFCPNPLYQKSLTLTISLCDLKECAEKIKLVKHY